MSFHHLIFQLINPLSWIELKQRYLWLFKGVRRFMPLLKWSSSFWNRRRQKTCESDGE